MKAEEIDALLKRVSDLEEKMVEMKRRLDHFESFHVHQVMFVEKTLSEVSRAVKSIDRMKNLL